MMSKIDSPQVEQLCTSDRQWILYGLRIDHVLVSDDLKQRCTACIIDTTPRQAERPSDHTPIWIAVGDRSDVAYFT